jgi:hypothetical protein
MLYVSRSRAIYASLQLNDNGHRRCAEDCSPSVNCVAGEARSPGQTFIDGPMPRRAQTPPQATTD